MNKFTQLIRTLCEPADTVETMLLDLYVAFLLSNASGGPLQTLGGWIGQKPEGLSDVELKKAIGARAIINKSTGSYRDLKRVTLAFVSTFALESGGGVALVRIGNVTFATASLLYRFLLKAIEVTVRLQVFYLPFPANQTFTYATAAITTSTISGGTVSVLGGLNLPDFGTVIVAAGTALQETATYTSRIGTTIFGLTTSNAHDIGTALQLTNNVNQGYSSTLAPTTGGHFAAVLGS